MQKTFLIKYRSPHAGKVIIDYLKLMGYNFGANRDFSTEATEKAEDNAIKNSFAISCEKVARGNVLFHGSDVVPEGTPTFEAEKDFMAFMAYLMAPARTVVSLRDVEVVVSPLGNVKIGQQVISFEDFDKIAVAVNTFR